MKGYAVGSQWWWQRQDKQYTRVEVIKSLRGRLVLRANISGLVWETKAVRRLFA